MEILRTRTAGATEVAAVIADLTSLEVDAVVNAANVHLQHGGGVAGALARAAGPSMQEQSNRWVADHGPLDVGQAAVTVAGSLPCRHVIHVAGPVYGEGEPDDESHLRAAVRGALEAADEAGATSVALPAISAGIYGYPPDDATAVIADEVVTVAPATSLERVLLVGVDRATAERFASGLDHAGA